MWCRALLLLAVAATTSAADDHLVCFSDEAVFHYQRNCETREGRYSEVEAAPTPRRLFWASRAQNAAAIGVLGPRVRLLSSLVDGNCCTIAVPESVVGPEGEDATVTITGGTIGTWTFTLPPWWFRKGRLNIAVPRDIYESIRIRSASGKMLLDTRGPDFRRSPQAAVPVVVTGRAVAKDGQTPAAFAEITLDCRRVVCTADANGRFRCPLRAASPRAICVEHADLGRARRDIRGRVGAVDLQTVALQPGAAIRVIRPLHVELPVGTTLSLQRGDQEVHAPEDVGDRDEIEVAGLEGGKYHVILAGPEPLQRKSFEVEARGRALAEVHLGIEPYRLTGRALYGERPLAGARVEVNGEVGKATLRTDDSGAFSAELWDSDSFAVVVHEPSLAQPWGVMKRASVTENEWRLEIPSRTIGGRVIDGDSTKGVARARVAIESETNDGTRWSRTIMADDDGQFEIAGVGEGRYKLTARQVSFLSSEPREIVVSESTGNPQAFLVLHRGVEVHIVATDPHGTALEGATILSELSPTGDRANRVTLTDAAGRATITLRPRTSTTAYMVGRSGSFAPVHFGVDMQAKELAVIVPQPAGTLRVVALSEADDAPIRGLSVLLRYNGQPVPRAVISRLAALRGGTAVTDERGRWELSELPAGVYEFAFALPEQQRPPLAWHRVDVARGTTTVTQRLASR